MNERQKRAVCERLARICRRAKSICPMTRLSKVCPDWDAPCPFSKHCGQITEEDWQEVSAIPSAAAVMESYIGGSNG